MADTFQTDRYVIKGERNDMRSNEAVRARILELLREQDISENMLCKLSGVRQSTVNDFMNDRSTTITITTVKKLCNGFGISVRDFFQSDFFRNVEQEIR